MRGNTGLAAIFAAGCLVLSAVWGEVTVDWDDLTDAQQRQAYEQLESENHMLREQLAALQGSGGSGAGTPGPGTSGTAQDGSSSTEGTVASAGAGSEGGTSPAAGTGSAEGTSAAAGTDGSQSTQIKSTETFLSDLTASFNARQEKARTHTSDELSAMDTSAMWDFRFECAEVERAFYDAYHTAQIDDLNLCYLCSEYCLGLEKQFQAKEIWDAQQDADEANRLYTAGYYNRAYALVELSEYYGLDLADEYQNLKNAVARMDSMSGEETRNSSVDPSKVTQVQELLNSLGFLCGTPDGIAGRQTASCIERFQNMYGYEPADGIIDDELITQLNDQASRR